MSRPKGAPSRLVDTALMFAVVVAFPLIASIAVARRVVARANWDIIPGLAVGSASGNHH